MAVELTKSEEDSLSKLAENMNSRLVEFQQEYQNKTKQEIQQELTDLEEYLKGCYNSEIDDTETNIRFCEGKSLILKSLLKKFE